MAPTIKRFVTIATSSRAETLGEIEQVFFAASNTQTFADDVTKATFRQRWLGRYLENDVEYVHIAVDNAQHVLGYLVGCVDDPAITPRFSDIGYFDVFAPLTRLFPAHLHVNLTKRARGSGTGGRLVDAFCDQLRALKIGGVHVVTSQGARNVAFYQRLGFEERGQHAVNGNVVVLLGRQV